MTSNHIIATMTLDTIVAFVIRMVALLTSTPVMMREEHLWNLCVLQRVHLPNLVEQDDEPLAFIMAR
jgi:hypothetical protein